MCMSVFVHVYMCACVCVCLYVYVCVYVCVCMLQECYNFFLFQNYNFYCYSIGWMQLHVFHSKLKRKICVPKWRRLLVQYLGTILRDKMCVN